ncbi:MAG: sugar transferase [Chloroflexota bacterium]
MSSILASENTSVHAQAARSLPLSQGQRRLVILVGLLIGDAATIAAAFFFAYWIRFELLPYTAAYSLASYARLALILVPAWLVIFAAFQMYDSNNLFGGLREYSQTFNAVTFGTVLIVALAYFFQRDTEELISRGWVVIAWVLALALVIGERFSLRRVVYALRQRGHLLTPALVVGGNAEGRALAEQLRDWKTSGLYIQGFVDDELAPGSPVENGYKVLGGLDDLERLVAEGGVQELIIAPTALSREQLLAIFQQFTQNRDVRLRLSSGLFEILTTGLRVKELAYVPLIELQDTRITGMDAILKAVLDYSLTIPGLILISPLLGILALAVKLTSPGPVIHRRRVMGLNGQQFDAFKFRTMYVNGDEILAAHPELQAELDENFKLKDDPRLTPIGDFLRKYSLDELPQLFNVLLGQMSLVGPRMISPPEMEKYNKWGMNLLTVKPGITGMWQVSGRSDVIYEERVRMDMSYIRNWTVWADLFLLFKTPLAVLRKKGAY